MICSSVGLGVTDAEGDSVSPTSVGASLGDAVGASLGDSVGASLGDAVGASLGDVVGLEGATVGFCVGRVGLEEVGDPVVGAALGTTPHWPCGLLPAEISEVLVGA